MKKTVGLKIAAAVCLSVTIIAVGLLLFAAWAANTETAENWLERRINGRLTGRLEISGHRLSLWGRYLEFTGVTLSAGGEEPALDIGRLRIGVDPLALTERTLEITAIRLEQPTVRLKTEPDGRLNLLAALGSKKKGHPSARKFGNAFLSRYLPQSMKIDTLRISDAHVFYENENRMIEGQCPTLTMSGGFGFDGRFGRVTAKAEDIRVKTPERSLAVPSLEASGALKDSHLDPLRLAVNTSLGDLAVNGEMKDIFRSPTTALNIKSGVDLAALKRFLNFGPDLTGRLKLTAVMKGELTNPVIEARLTSPKAVIGPTAINRFSCTLDGSARAVDLKARADIPDSGHLSVDAGFPLAEVFPEGFFGKKRDFDHLRYEANIDGSRLDFRKWLDRQDLPRGRADVHAQISGQGISPQRLAADFTAQITVPDLQPEGFPNSLSLTARAGGQWQDGAIRLERLSAEAPGLDLTAHGRFEPADRRVDGRLDLAVTDIKKLTAPAGFTKAAGRMEAAVTVAGKLSDIKAQATVTGEQVAVSAVTVDQVNGQASLDRDELVIENLGLRRRDSLCQLKGIIHLSGNTGVSNGSDPTLDLTILPNKVYLEDFFDPTVSGEVLVSGRVNGPLKNPAGDVSLRTDNLVILDSALETRSATVHLADRVLDVAVVGDPDLSGRLNLKDLSFSARCRADETPLGPWLAMADKPDLNGSLTGNLQATGNLKDIPAVRATAEIDRMALSFNQRSWIRTEPFRLDYENRVLLIPGLQMAVAEEGDFSFSGRLGADGTVDLAVDGTIPAAMAEMVVPDILYPTGRLVVDTDISGTFKKPDLNGRVELVGVGFGLPDFSHKLHDIVGEIRFDRKTVRVEGIRGGLGKGRFELSGRAALAGYRPDDVDLRLTAESIPVVIPDVMDLRLNADLAFVRNIEKKSVQGTVLLLDGVYYRDVQLVGYTDLVRAPFRKQRRLPPEHESEMPAFLKDVSLDLALNYRLPLKVDNNIALLEVKPDLTVKGTLANPVLLGQARVDDGEVVFRRKTFLVERGLVSFTNPYQTSPAIDIAATTTVKQWHIFLKISGTPDALQVQLTSDPQEEQGDILSLLMFGRPARDLTAASGAAQPPAQILANFLATTMEDDLKNITGLDIVEIDPSEGGQESGLGKITLGSKVSDRLTLKYAVESSRDDGVVQESASEYQLTENASVSAFQDSRGVFGGRLTYRLEFR